MTTAHRPTLDPVRGRRDANSGSILHARILPAHTKLKFRQKGQGGDGDGPRSLEEMKRELEVKEKEHDLQRGVEPQLVKKQKLIEQFQDEDRDLFPDTLQGHEDSDEDSDDSDDSDDGEQEALQEALRQIRQERDHARRVQEEQAQRVREVQIAGGNPLLGSDFQVKRKWNDDAVFKNQARSSQLDRVGFVNDSLHSEFHKRFMEKYVR